MSLVAYGSSDESENEEETNEQPKEEIKTLSTPAREINTNFSKMQLPTPKSNSVNVDNSVEEIKSPDTPMQELNTNSSEWQLPTPKSDVTNVYNNNEEAIEAPLLRKIDYGVIIEKPPPKKRGPTRITIPSLSDFKDLESENESSRPKVKPSKAGTGLFSVLPPPISQIRSGIKSSMVPYVLTKKPVEPNKITSTKTIVPQSVKTMQKSVTQSKSTSSTLKSLSNYNSDSDSEDDKGASSGMDFFSLTTDTKIPDDQMQPMSTEDIEAIAGISSNRLSNDEEENSHMEESESNRKLVSNVMNLPKEEIILKNKAEVGPKLPVPEQEYNVDSQGNVAFDEKAIEYLCGKRGVKRKNEFSNVDIVEISGEDIKPDEKEWLVKALTEETVRRTSASAGAGPSGQSKKKHQITYLAHQAKSMELELKNQWAQNKASRQQTRSKYGF